MERMFQEPLKAFRFLVELDGRKVAVAAFTGFSGVQMEVEGDRAVEDDSGFVFKPEVFRGDHALQLHQHPVADLPHQGRKL